MIETTVRAQKVSRETAPELLNLKQILEAEEQIGTIPDEDVVELQQQLAAAPSDPFLYLWLGLAARHRGQWQAAIDAFGHAIDRGCTHWRVGWYIAQVAKSAGQLSVVDDACACDPAEVPAQVVALRAHRLGERPEPSGGEGMDLGRLVRAELAELALVPRGRHHQVPGRVRVLVQQHERAPPAVHRERRLVVRRARGAAEQAALQLVRRADVLEAPRRPQRLRHADGSTSIRPCTDCASSRPGPGLSCSCRPRPSCACGRASASRSRGSPRTS